MARLGVILGNVAVGVLILVVIALVIGLDPAINKNLPQPPQECGRLVTVRVLSAAISIPSRLSPVYNDPNTAFTFVANFTTSRPLDQYEMGRFFFGLQTYATEWPDLARVKGFRHKPGTASTYEVQIATYAPVSRPGLYELTWGVNIEYGVDCKGVHTTRTLAATVDVTCSIYTTNWCDGEFRYIPAFANTLDRCARTYKPCGQELAVGVPNPDNCTRYACDAVTRTCALAPEGGAACRSCTPVNTGPAPVADCRITINNVTTNKTCGDDGAGGSCGTCGGSTPTCDPTTFQCVAAQLGNCQNPYPLFGTTKGAGAAGLNSNDKEGITYFALANGLTPSEPLNVTNLTAVGWPLDGLTVPSGGARLRIFVNSEYYSDSLTMEGNAEGIRDVSFTFRVGPQDRLGVDVYLLSQNGVPGDRDTYVAIVNADCTDIASQWWTSPADVFRSDDASPPGGYGSHASATGLAPGNYTIVITTYSNQEAGPMWLEVVFPAPVQQGTPCAPACTGRICGNNNCGGLCNVQQCSGNLECNNGKCSFCPQGAQSVPVCQDPGSPNWPYPYNTSYTRHCGADVNNCGGSCGTCPSGQECNLEVGVCMPVSGCDPMVPFCSPSAFPAGGNRARYYCSNACEWTDIDAQLSEMIPNPEERVAPEIEINWRYFDELTCALDEACVSGTGWRLLFRFNTDIHNIGNVTYTSEPSFTRPDLFTWAKCHGHYHMRGFAAYDLINVTSGNLIMGGGKLSYCVEATETYQEGPKVPCETSFSCDNQGLDAGWTDRYSKDLDCQWIDITPLMHAGQLGQWFTYSVGVNLRRIVPEYSFLNNVAKFPVYIPCAPPVNSSINYVDLFANDPTLCCAQPDSFLCSGILVNCTGVPLPSGPLHCPPITIPTSLAL